VEECASLVVLPIVVLIGADEHVREPVAIHVPGGRHLDPELRARLVRLRSPGWGGEERIHDDRVTGLAIIDLNRERVRRQHKLRRQLPSLRVPYLELPITEHARSVAIDEVDRSVRPYMSRELR